MMTWQVRNLLEEFTDTEPLHHGEQPRTPHERGPKPITLVGYPEHIFSQSAGFATSIYAAMQVLSYLLPPTSYLLPLASYI